MSTGTLLAIIIVVVVVIAVAVAASMVMRRRKLRERFGPEYERTMGDAGSRMAGERKLRAREKRRDALDIKPLDSSVRDRYTRDWSSTQEEFVDRQEDAVHDADRLVTSLMHERGYPTRDFEQQLKDLSVEQRPHTRALPGRPRCRGAQHPARGDHRTTAGCHGALPGPVRRAALRRRRTPPRPGLNGAANGPWPRSVSPGIRERWRYAARRHTGHRRRERPAAAGRALAQLLAASEGRPVTVPDGLIAEVFQRALDALLPAGPPTRRVVLAGPGRAAPDADAGILVVPAHPQTGEIWTPDDQAASANSVPLPFGVWLWLALPEPYLPVPASGGMPDGVLRDDPPAPHPPHLFRADPGAFQDTLAGCRPSAARGCARSSRTSRSTCAPASSSQLAEGADTQSPTSPVTELPRSNSAGQRCLPKW